MLLGHCLCQLLADVIYFFRPPKKYLQRVWTAGIFAALLCLLDEQTLEMRVPFLDSPLVLPLPLQEKERILAGNNLRRCRVLQLSRGRAQRESKWGWSSLYRLCTSHLKGLVCAPSLTILNVSFRSYTPTLTDPHSLQLGRGGGGGGGQIGLPP
jgi:hypothetical protein